MSHFGFSIDQATNDLHLAADGDVATVTEALAVGQDVRQRLMTYAGEWFLDTGAGMPWLNQIMGRGYDAALAEAIVKAEILATDGVSEITSFSIGFDRAARRLDVRQVEVGTVYDQEVQV